jgi:hypothetical protein
VYRPAPEEDGNGWWSHSMYRIAQYDQEKSNLNDFLASRQVYKEAQPIFYSANKFVFSDAPTLSGVSHG